MGACRRVVDAVGDLPPSPPPRPTSPRPAPPDPRKFRNHFRLHLSSGSGMAWVSLIFLAGVSLIFAQPQSINVCSAFSGKQVPNAHSRHLLLFLRAGSRAPGGIQASNCDFVFLFSSEARAPTLASTNSAEPTPKFSELRPKF